jgi:hypothetical protein
MFLHVFVRCRTQIHCLDQSLSRRVDLGHHLHHPPVWKATTYKKRKSDRVSNLPRYHQPSTYPFLAVIITIPFRLQIVVQLDLEVPRRTAFHILHEIDL